MLDHGAEGIGLYRTEFIYIDRTTMPTEAEQYELYRAVVEPWRRGCTAPSTSGGQVRVELPALRMNPALGLRAVRLALSRPDVFLTQLRAMIRASAHGDLRIMIPMVASVCELRESASLPGRAMQEVESAGYKSASTSRSAS